MNTYALASLAATCMCQYILRSIAWRSSVLPAQAGLILVARSLCSCYGYLCPELLSLLFVTVTEEVKLYIFPALVVTGIPFSNK